jgi:leucyl-tRNA synthetase
VWTVTLDPTGHEAGDPESGKLPAGESAADAAAAIRAAAHRTLRDVTEDYEGFRFNTMVAKLMELSNTLYRYRGTEVAGDTEWDEAVRLLLLMLAPAAPHITEEIWARQAEAAGREWTSIHTGSWPTVDEGAIKVSVREVPVQVNGKLRDRIVVAADATEDQIKAEATAGARIQTILAGRTPERIVVAGGGKLVNIVVRD